MPQFKIVATSIAFATLALACTDAVHASPLAWSYGFAATRECYEVPCSVVVIDQAQQYDYNFNVALTVDSPGFGSATLSALPGASFALPALRAGSTVTGPATSTAFVMAFQGFRNTSTEAFDLAFEGILDFTRSGGSGFVTPSLAILDTSVRDPDIGFRWVESTNDGRFIADCDTPGAVAVLNPGNLRGTGDQAEGIDTSDGMCDGGSLFRVEPGQEFYLLARLLTFQVMAGSTDALNTFELGFSPKTPEGSLALARQFLTTQELRVSEPGTLGLLGLSVFGIVLGRRRTCA